MPFGSRKFFSGKVRPGASSVPAVLSPSGVEFRTTKKFGSHSLFAKQETVEIGPGQFQTSLVGDCQITVYPKNSSFYLNSQHAWTVEWWMRTEAQVLLSSPSLFVKVAQVHSNKLSQFSSTKFEPSVLTGQYSNPENYTFYNDTSLTNDFVDDDGYHHIYNRITPTLFSPSLYLDSWLHCAIISTGTGVYRHFINGFGQTPQSWNYTDYNKTFAFGAWCVGSGINAKGLYFDEIRISNIARYPSSGPNQSGSGDQRIYTRPTSAFTADENTLALFHLDNNFTDSSIEGL